MRTTGQGPGDVEMRIVEAQEAERSRLAQEIHDGPAQALSNAIFQVEYIERVLDQDPRMARNELRFLRELLRRELGDVRTFISQLRPPLLDELGLAGSIKDVAETMGSLAGITVDTDLQAADTRLGSAQQTVVLRVVQEALQNVRKHAKAKRASIATRIEDRAGSSRSSTTGSASMSVRSPAAADATLGSSSCTSARSCSVPSSKFPHVRRRHGRPVDRPARKGEHMSAMDYSGPDRRRGGPDRRNMEQTKLLLVDDHALFRMGVRGLLEREPDFLIVGEADDSRSAIELALETSPDIILMDLTLAPRAIETTQRIKRELPSVGIIVLAQNEDEDALFDAIKAGAAAFILKDVGPDDLVTIIRRVSAGEYLINDKVFAKPAVASRVLKEFRELAVYGQDAAPIFAPLSPREVEILDNIAQGMTNKQVAYALSISEQTVKNHMSSILRKLSVNDRTQAVVYAMRQGWIRMPED